MLCIPNSKLTEQIGGFNPRGSLDQIERGCLVTVISRLIFVFCFACKINAAFLSSKIIKLGMNKSSFIVQQQKQLKYNTVIINN